MVLANPEVADKLKFASLLSISIFAVIVALGAAFLAFFRRRAALQFEILALRHQLGVLQRALVQIGRSDDFGRDRCIDPKY